MSDPHDMEHSDKVRIDVEPLSGVTFEVSDVEVQDLGLTEVVVVSLLSGCERYAIKWAKHSDTAEVVHLDGDSEWEITLNDIVAVEDE